MPGQLKHMSPERARQIFDSLPKGQRTIAGLFRELTRRGQVVSRTTLKKWKANGFKRKAEPRSSLGVRELRDAVERVGLPLDSDVRGIIQELENRLATMSDGDLVVHTTRALLINAALLMEHATVMAPTLMERDPRGLAALYLAANNMTTGAHDLLREARNLSERAMKEKSLMLMGPGGVRDDDRGSERDGGRPAFAGLIERFGSVRAPISQDDDAIDGDAVEVFHTGNDSLN